MINVARYGALGLVGGTIAGATIKPKTRNGEHSVNKFSTAVGLGALAATPYLVKQAVKANPELATKVATKVGAGIEKATEYAAKAANSDTARKAINYISAAFHKVKSTKIGSKVVDAVTKFAKKVASNKTVQNVATKASAALKKFAMESPAGKGKIALIATGFALLAYAGYKTITNFYKKEGAIDQKYKDMEIMDKVLA